MAFPFPEAQLDPIATLRDALADRYTIERELGRGGMATVFLARDLKHDRPVALKVLHPELAASLGPDRFQREIRVAARLQHPHVLTVLDSGAVGTAGGSERLWFTMPYVQGESLRERLVRERQLPVDDALRVAREAARASARADLPTGGRAGQIDRHPRAAARDPVLSLARVASDRPRVHAAPRQPSVRAADSVALLRLPSGPHASTLALSHIAMDRGLSARPARCRPSPP